MSKKKSKGKQPEYEDMEGLKMDDVVTDSEEEYTETERKLLEKVRKKNFNEDYDSDMEVYGFPDTKDNENEDSNDGNDGDEDNVDSMESDIEGQKEELDLPDERAWGKKKKTYYHTDYVDPDYGSANQKDLAQAEIEEQEARNIQKRLAEQLDDADFGLDFAQEVVDQKIEEDAEHIVKTDLSKLSKRQKYELMQKESPEFTTLVSDFKVRMAEAQDVFAPFLKLVKDRVIPPCPAVSFVKTKYYLVLNYCINISFYLMLKAKRLPVNSHPVIKRLAQYRQLLNQLEGSQGKVLHEIHEILNAERAGKPLYSAIDGTLITKPMTKSKISGYLVESTKKKIRGVWKVSKGEISDDESVPEPDFETMKLNDVGDDYIDDEDKYKSDLDDESAGIEDNMDLTEKDSKRAITYQMAKNRGLTPHRKKELRNPRVKHRNKYRKAKIRRKGAVREVRKELQRYGGEISGIKAGVKKGIKLK